MPLVSVIFFSDGKDKTHGLVYARARDAAFHVLIPNLIKGGLEQFSLVTDSSYSQHNMVCCMVC